VEPDVSTVGPGSTHDIISPADPVKKSDPPASTTSKMYCCSGDSVISAGSGVKDSEAWGFSKIASLDTSVSKNNPSVFIVESVFCEETCKGIGSTILPVRLVEAEENSGDLGIEGKCSLLDRPTVAGVGVTPQFIGLACFTARRGEGSLKGLL
jgi:hypothetical protein